MDLLKLRKKIPDDILDRLDTLSPADLEAELRTCEEAIHEAQEYMREDPQVVALKETLKEVLGPSRDVIKLQRSKIAYVLHRLNGD